jgi:general secretion pathway protein K
VTCKAVKQSERGIALLVVLWVMVLLAVVLGGFAVLARSEDLQTRHLFDSARARYAAEAGLARAVYELRRTDPNARWVADGRPYEIEFDGARVEVTVVDESGKVDINAADEQTLLRLLQGLGAGGGENPDPDRPQRLVDAMMDWRDGDDLVRPMGAEDADYEAAGYAYGASDIGFTTIEELQQVMGMDYELFRKLEPVITVYSRSNRPNAVYAPESVLATLPGMTPDIAAGIIAQRMALPPDQLAVAPIQLPDGAPLVGGGGGVTYTVRARATLPNGAWTLLETIIRPGGAPAGRAYSILRWRTGKFQ